MRSTPLILLLSIALIAVGVRAALPELLERYVNRVLDRTENYEGRVEDIDLALWRGAYTIEGLVLDHTQEEELRPLLTAKRVDLSLEWKALLRGELVGEVHAEGVVYNVVAAPPEDDDILAQSGEDPDLAERLSELLPVSLNRLEVQDGEIHYLDPHSSPRVDLALRQVHLLAVNWSNARHREAERFGRAELRATAFRSARFSALLEADPLASPPEFRFEGISEGIDLVDLNDFLRAYGGFDAEKGQLSVYTEIDSSDGRYEGYVKPLVDDLEILGDEEGDWTKRLWEGFAGLVAEAFENQASGRQASRIPIEGEWEEASPDLWSALGSVLYNAFIQALPPRLEHPERLSRKRAES
jgi:uncharacterized protein YhdP